MARAKKETFITYCVMGKRNGMVIVLGYSRDLGDLKDRLRLDGWKDSEFLVEELIEE